MLCPKCNTEMFLSKRTFVAWNVVAKYVAAYVCQNPNCLEILTAEIKPKPTSNECFGMFITRVLVEYEMVSSLAEARRCIAQGGVKINGKVVKKVTTRLKKGDTIQVGTTRNQVFEALESFEDAE